MKLKPEKNLQEKVKSPPQCTDDETDFFIRDQLMKQS